jgi:hypothetical protein
VSHFGVLVCLPPGTGANWRPATEAALRPYRIDDETGLGEWDHWFSEGELWVRPDRVGDPLIVPSLIWPADPLRCNGGPVGALDLAGMRAAAVATARSLWAGWHESARRNPPARSWDELRPRYPDARSTWAAYHAQPLIDEVRARAAVQDDVFHQIPLDDTDHFGFFGDDEERFVDRQARDAVLSYALVTPDGRWLDREQTPGYLSLLGPCLDGLPDDAFLIELTCHS